MRCRGVIRREVGMKFDGMQECVVFVRPGVRSCQSVRQVAVGTKVNRVGASTRSVRGRS